MELKKSWKRAWDLGHEMAKRFEDEDSSINAMPIDALEDFAEITGYDAFFHAGFIGREPELVEAIRYGEIPAAGRSINWAENTWEPGVSCVKIIRTAEDANYQSIYAMTLQDRELIRVRGWYIGGSGSDGEPTIWGCEKI